ncbi:hypothetical protein [Citrobacter sp. wls713]|uniref:hypothetical protein n=1 Tax=Citrobacter sp. wls713 TaxID=2576423 RepID=UPI001484E36B|nr:hypothetical protein [Citrobacter sp. wls713]
MVWLCLKRLYEGVAGSLAAPFSSSGAIASMNSQEGGRAAAPAARPLSSRPVHCDLLIADHLSTVCMVLFYSSGLSNNRLMAPFGS